MKALKIEHEEQMTQMNSISPEGLARTIWDDPAKAMTLHKFWEQVASGNKNPIGDMAKLEMRRIEAIMLKMTDINSGFYGSRAQAYLDSYSTQIVDVEEDTSKIEEILPVTSEEDAKKVSLFSGKEMGDKPEQMVVSAAAKKLLSEGKKDDAIALAKQYFGTGNYTPKKEGAEAKKWQDKQITNWIVSLESGLKDKKTGTTEVKPKVESNEDLTDINSFGRTKLTLKEEETAFDLFAKRYVDMATAGTEDTEAAESLAALFFKNRAYEAEQITTWKQTVTANDSLEGLDHFAILKGDNELEEYDKTYDEINEEIKTDLDNRKYTGTELKDEAALKVKVTAGIVRSTREAMIGKTITGSEDTTYPMWTSLHHKQLIETLVTANFRIKDPEVSSTSDQESKDSSSTSPDANAKPVKKVVDPVKDITMTIIHNGGILEDVGLSNKYAEYVGENKEYIDEASMMEYITANFQTWSDDWRNSLTHYPYHEFDKALIGAFEQKGTTLEEFVKGAKEYIVKPDGSVLTLKRKALHAKEDPSVIITPELLVPFDKAEDFVEYINNAWGALETTKAAVEKATEETDSETSSDDQTEETESNVEKPVKLSDIVVKMAHITSICNKALKKKRDHSFLLKDKKIRSLIVEGGAIESLDKKTKVDYDLTADSVSRLEKDLKAIFDSVKEGKIMKGEAPASEEKEEVVETDPSVITSFNEIMPAGMKMIESGCSKENLLQWGVEVLLNRKMKEQGDATIYASTDKVHTFIKGLFSDFFEKKQGPVENTYTIEQLKADTKSASEEEGITYPLLTSVVNELCKVNNFDLPGRDRLELVRTTIPEMYKAHMDKQDELHAETKEKVFVPEKISEGT